MRKKKPRGLKLYEINFKYTYKYLLPNRAHIVLINCVITIWTIFILSYLCRSAYQPKTSHRCFLRCIFFRISLKIGRNQDKSQKCTLTSETWPWNSILAPSAVIIMEVYIEFPPKGITYHFTILKMVSRGQITRSMTEF